MIEFPATMRKQLAFVIVLCFCISPLSFLLNAEDAMANDSWNEEYRFFGIEPKKEQEEISFFKESESSKEINSKNMYAGNVIPTIPKKVSTTNDVPEPIQATVSASDFNLDKIKENFLIFGNLTLLGSYSSLINSSSITGGNINGYLAPAYKISEKAFFIFLINGMYNKSKQVYVQDDGPRLSTETRSFSITPTLKYTLSDTLSISPSLIYTRSQALQDATVNWGYDLYDYTEIGGSLVLESNLENTDKIKRDLSFTLQSYHRDYPNYISLLNLSGLGSLEEKEKDFDGFLVIGGYTVSQPLGLSYTLNGNILYKKFSDKLIENESGERDNKKQKDVAFTLGTNFQYRYREDTTFLLDATYIYNLSNQNLAVGTFPSVEFTRDYYTFHNLIFSTGVQHTLQLLGKDLTVKGQYGYNITQYIGRNAKDSSGNIIGKEQDFTQEVSFNATYKLNDKLDLLLATNIQRLRSNMKEETTFRYNYSLFNFSLGLSYSF